MPSKNKIAVDIKSSFDKKGVTDAKSGLSDIKNSSDTASSALKGVTSSGLTIASIGTAITTVVSNIKMLTDAWGVQETAEIKMEAVLQATGNRLMTNIIEVQDYATELSNLTGIEDEMIIAAEGVMATFTKIGKDVFPDAIEKAADMSAMFGQDLQQSAIQLGTALNDPIAGIGRLKRIGISFTEEQKNMIKGFMEVNDIASAQSVILDELEAEFGGVAAAMGDSAAGSAQKLTNAWGDLLEQGGRALEEVFRPAKQILTDILSGITSYMKETFDTHDIGKKILEGSATTAEKIWYYQKQTDEAQEKFNALLEESINLGKAIELDTPFSASFERDLEKVNIKLREAGEKLNVWNSALQDAIDEETEQNRILEEEHKAADYLNDSWSLINGQIASLSDPLKYQLETIKNQITAAEEFLSFGKENHFEAEETAEIQLAINLMKEKEAELEEQIAEAKNKSNKELSLFEKMEQDAIKEIQKQNDLIDIQENLETLMTSATEEQLEVYKVMKAEVDKLLGVEEERKNNADELSLYAQMAAEWEDEQIRKEEEKLALIQAQAAMLDAMYRGNTQDILMNQEIISRLTVPDSEAEDESDNSEEKESPSWIDSLSSNELIMLFSEGTDVADLFISTLLNAALEVEGLSELLNGISYVFEMIFDTLGPYAIAIINPFLGILKQIADSMASSILPILVILAPIISVLADIISTILVPFLSVFSVQLSILTVIFNLVLPILQGIAIAFEVLAAPVRWLADLFAWVGEIITVFAYNITHWFNPKSYPGAFESDAFSGLDDRIAAILDAGNIEVDDEGTSSGTTVYGGNTTVNKPPDIYVYINFHGPVVAEGGLAKVGEFVAESLQEYIGIGGKLEFLEDAT